MKPLFLRGITLVRGWLISHHQNLFAIVYTTPPPSTNQKPIGCQFAGAKCLRSHGHLAILRNHCIGSLGVQGGDKERL